MGHGTLVCRIVGWLIGWLIDFIFILPPPFPSLHFTSSSCFFAVCRGDKSIVISWVWIWIFAMYNLPYIMTSRSSYHFPLQEKGLSLFVCLFQTSIHSTKVPSSSPSSSRRRRRIFRRFGLVWMMRCLISCYYYCCCCCCCSKLKVLGIHTIESERGVTGESRLWSLPLLLGSLRLGLWFCFVVGLDVYLPNLR